MIGIETAILGAGAMGAAGNIFSSVFGAGAANKQAKAITESANIASRTALELDNRARADVAPFRTLGLEAGDLVSKILSGELNLDEALGKSSIFKWEQQEGERALNRQLAARGLYGSGAGLETLARFNAQLTAEEGARYWDRIFNTTTLGANAAARMATNTTQTGNNVANMQAQAGIAAAQATGDAGRSIASIGPGIAGPLANAGMNYMGYSIYQPILNRLAGNAPASGTSGYVRPDLDFDTDPSVYK